MKVDGDDHVAALRMESIEATPSKAADAAALRIERAVIPAGGSLPVDEYTNAIVPFSQLDNVLLDERLPMEGPLKRTKRQSVLRNALVRMI